MRNSPRGAWPTGLIGMFAFVFGVELYVAKHGAKFTTAHAAAWRRSGEVVPKAVGCDVVAVGDSLVKNGLVAPVVADRLGMSVYNLAVPKGMFPGHDAVLRRLLRAGAKPKALVVDGEMLGEDPFENERMWPELLTFPECADLALVGRDPFFLARMALAKALPSYKARAEIRLSVTMALEGKVPPEPAALPILRRNWTRNAGSQVIPDRNDPPGHDPRPAQLDRENYRPSRWACHPVNDVYVGRFLDRAGAAGIPVVWLLPPYHPEVEARRERFGQYVKYVAYLRGLTDRYPNLTVVDGRNAGYPPPALFDMTHLSRTGALAYSDAVGRLLRERLDGPGGAAAGGWVRLPKYDPASAAALAASPAGEDLTQSSRALERARVEERQKRRERRLARGDRPDGERRR